jgi:hypothetical protein
VEGPRENNSELQRRCKMGQRELLKIGPQTLQEAPRSVFFAQVVKLPSPTEKGPKFAVFLNFLTKIAEFSTIFYIYHKKHLFYTLFCGKINTIRLWKTIFYV